MAFNKARALQEAERTLAQGKVGQAIQQYLQIIENDPSDLNLINMTGDLCVRDDSVPEALQLFRKLAEAYVREGFFLRAIAIYKKILKLDPIGVDSMLKLAELYTAQGLSREARDLYTQALTVCQRQNLKERAIEVIRKMVAGEPANVGHLVHLAECCRAIGRVGEAFRAYLDAAEAALNQGDPSAAAVLEQAAALQPSDSRLQELRRRLTLEPEPSPPPLPEPELPPLAEPQPASSLQPEVPARQETVMAEPPQGVEGAVAPSGLASVETAPVEAPPLEATHAEGAPIEPVSAEAVPSAITPSENAQVEQTGAAPRAEEPIVAEVLVGETIAAEAIEGEELPAETTPPEVQQAEEDESLEIDLSAEWEAVEAAFQVAPIVGPTAEWRAIEPASPASPAGEPVPESQPLEIAPIPAMGELPAEWQAAEPAPQQSSMGVPTAAEQAVESATPALPISELTAEWEPAEPTLPAPPIAEPTAKLEAAPQIPAVSQLPGTPEALEKAPPVAEFNFEESAAEIDFYLEYGMADEARRTLSRLEGQHPGNPQVVKLRHKLEPPSLPESAAPVMSPESLAPFPPQGPPEPHAELMAAISPESPAPPPVPNPFDSLAQDLASSWQGPEQSAANPPPVKEPRPTGSKADFAASLGSLLNELGTESADTRPYEDPQTHHDLGIAFREMGLIDEAIGEFQKAVRGAQPGAYPPQFLSSCSLLALCFMEKQMPSLAVRWYARALELPHLDPEAALALHYDLGLAYEQAGNREAARERFLEVYSQNIDYRDVAEKVRQLAARS